MLNSSDYVDSEGDGYALPPRAVGSKPILFGHQILDRAIPGGIPIHAPGVFLVQGPTGFGKTTFILNMIANMYTSNLPDGFKTFYWNVESLMTMEHTQTMLRCILAAKIMVHAFHGSVGYDYILGPFYNPGDKTFGSEYFDICREILGRVSDMVANSRSIPKDPEDAISTRLRRDLLPLTPQFMKSTYKFKDKYKLTPSMRDAWLVAGYCMKVMGYVTAGPSEHVDKPTRKSRSDEYHNDMGKSGKKWLELVEECDGNCQLIVDHSTAFEVGQANDYEKQKMLKPYLKAILDKYPILIWVVIQDGVTNQRDFERLGYVLGAQGGDALAQEVSLSWRKKRHDRDKNPFWDVLQKPLKSRIGIHPELAFMIVPGSGAYIGEARLASEVIV